MKHALIVILRISMGWLLFYAGITKVLNSEWTSAGYLAHAQTFSGIYQWLASPEIIIFVDLLNQWGLTLLGLSLLIGAFVRLSAVLGAILMLLYYFPVLHFPYVGEHSYLVADHLIYILVLLLLGAVHAGKQWGFDGKFPNIAKQLG